ncbi:uncharacterized protein N0V89_008836 [Didymosphaeria variabile]|uniref:Uncharacterized protein n=1 Tax=Didymosphaeria variabile TaxID=1932322 RepID=A0A9W8XH14_9PLEO|nr:uncharacterized protein N0V89_008836 [Didymosphaeria variabile]KAJ4350215.1 hypothetical protein N0V89_008836 [Didymosphaeria variabile]
MIQPFPPMIDGGASDASRHAVCRACGEISEFIQLREIQIMNRPRTKVTVMPLLNKGNGGELFCILLPQRNDRSLQRLELFRPYELTDGEITFSSNFEVLSPRNRSWVHTEEEAAEALGIPPNPTPSPSLSWESSERSLPMRPMTKTRLRSGKQRSASGGFVDRATRARDSPQEDLQDSPNVGSSQKRKKPQTYDSEDVDTPRQRRKTLRAPVSCMQAPTPVSREVSHAAPEIISNESSIILPGLNEEYAKRILLVWVVVVDDIEYDFSHTIYNCPTFSDFLTLVRTEAAYDPQVTEKVDSSLTWRLTYQISSQTKKAFTLRIDDSGQDTVYERLLSSLAQSTFWQENSNGKINVDLRILA